MITILLAKPHLPGINSQLVRQDSNYGIHTTKYFSKAIAIH
jgi:hypothetical protein